MFRCPDVSIHEIRCPALSFHIARAGVLIARKKKVSLQNLVTNLGHVSSRGNVEWRALVVHCVLNAVVQQLVDLLRVRAERADEMPHLQEACCRQ